jgi:acyl carrier protein
MSVSRTEIVATIQRCAHEIAEREFPPFEDAQIISALGMDSLSTLEMVGMIERELEIYLPTDDLTDIHTVGELASLCESKLKPTAP